ncbi:hypothetical protein C7N43_25265 [Sphingobacteriales bacterium UPWRP_1]|nr:hypothetical protein BVG80_17380 [Sphingobacteriales bacterium TSM_CSM]PSJ74206.1 hypothetical protein C7N43_25265 [Sphingobacteriales bacterium UPWRP_1]
MQLHLSLNKSQQQVLTVATAIYAQLIHAHITAGFTEPINQSLLKVYAETAAEAAVCLLQQVAQTHNLPEHPF